jgi:hypothetical protein
MVAGMKIQQIADYVWEIPKHGNMRVPGRVYASREMMSDLQKDASLEQVGKRRASARDCGLLVGDAGHSLGLRFPHRRESPRLTRTRERFHLAVSGTT